MSRRPPMLGSRDWTDDDLETLRINYADWPSNLIAAALKRTPGAVTAKAHELRLVKADDYRAKLEALRKRFPQLPTGGRFQPGQTPVNKGIKHRPGWAPGRMAKGQFKKGVRQGVAVKLWKPIGTERISKDGYLERKIHDGLPLQSRWRAVHILVWEAVNGPLPPGHAIAFLKGRFSNEAEKITIDAVELVSRAELMRRNTYHNNYPPEARQIIQLRGALTRKIRRREREK